MDDSTFTPSIGKLVCTQRKISVAGLHSMRLADWTGNVVSIPSNTPLLVLKFDKGVSKREPYWKLFLLFGETIVYMGFNASDAGLHLRPAPV